ncbi:hypothetical protein [Kocuria sp.]|uniref:hypothetical protein n=1 Tax=Kocuria sp. TaxID=1871328 RepID=UPI0026DF1DAF|nr:hypothetical protein [Kocuria sp.]MDO5617586.1 hypothetical protein [Kocuria sp.]
MDVLAPNPFETVMLLLMLLSFIVVVVASLMALIYLPKISRQLKRLEEQRPRQY